MARLLGHAENTGFSRDPKPRIPGSGHFFISLLENLLKPTTATVNMRLEQDTLSAVDCSIRRGPGRGDFLKNYAKSS